MDTILINDTHHHSVPAKVDRALRWHYQTSDRLPPAPEAVHPVALQCRLFKLWEEVVVCLWSFEYSVPVVCLWSFECSGEVLCASGVLSVVCLFECSVPVVVCLWSFECKQAVEELGGRQPPGARQRVRLWLHHHNHHLWLFPNSYSRSNNVLIHFDDTKGNIFMEYWYSY